MKLGKEEEIKSEAEQKKKSKINEIENGKAIEKIK